MIKNLDKKNSLRLLGSNYIGRLAYISQGAPSVVPITYYYDKSSNSVISYSGEGHKINAMRNNRFVSIQVDEIVTTNNWKSIAVHGAFEELHGTDAKYQLHLFTEGVRSLASQIENNHFKSIDEFSSKMPMSKVPIVYRIKIIEITGKLREP